MSEFDSRCGSPDGFCIVTFGGFSDFFVVGGGSSSVRLVGTYGYTVNFGFNSLRFTVERLANQSSTRTTGTLRLELWATATPYVGGSIFGYRVAEYQITGPSNGTRFDDPQRA